jgi:hypothetical protein
VIVAFFGFIWYPVKRLLRKRKIDKRVPERTATKASS